MRVTIINVFDKEVIETYIDGLWSRTDRRELGHVHIPDGEALKERAAQWADEEDKEANRKGGFVRTEGKKKDDQQQDQGNNNSRKRRPDNTVAVVDQTTETPRKYKKATDLLKTRCPLAGHGDHSFEECRTMRKAWGLPPPPEKDNPKKDDKNDKDKGKGKAPAGSDYQSANKVVAIIFGGTPSSESKHAKKLQLREIMAVEPPTPTYLKWSEVPISFDRTDQWTNFSNPGRYPLVLDPVVVNARLTRVLIDGGSGLNIFDRTDQWTNFSNPGRYPLVLDPVVVNARLTRVLIDGGSGLNIIFSSTLKKMDYDFAPLLQPTSTLFYGIMPGTAAMPLRQLTLPVTFGSKNNYRTEYIKFEVADFDTSYHAILGRPALAKFMAVPHYVYLVLKMPASKGVLSLRGDLRRSFDCDKEAVELAATSMVPAQRQEILSLSKETQEEPEFPERSPDKIKMKPAQDVVLKTIDLGTGDTSKTALIGSGLDDK